MQSQSTPIVILSLTGLILVLITSTVLAQPPVSPNTKPLAPDYTLNPDGSAEIRICFNSSCARTETLTFSTNEMEWIAEQVKVCPADNLHNRLQRLRIAVWQMEVLSQRHQPLLGNDLAVNDQEFGVEGRTDCVDNATNTSTFLHLLSDLGVLPGWSISTPSIRKPFDFNNVHWTAVVTEIASGEKWVVDSWFRRHGHLPFVLPLDNWKDEKAGWEAPFDRFNQYPAQSSELCESE